jgi:hypothetical protein
MRKTGFLMANGNTEVIREMQKIIRGAPSGAQASEEAAVLKQQTATLN